MLPVTLIALGMAASTARADDPTAEPSPAAERVTSYRKYTLTADVLSLSLMVAGGLAEGEGGRDTAASNTLMGVGSMGAVFATPIIHGIRGHFGRSLGSLALRSGLGALGGSLGFAMADCRGSDDIVCGLDLVGPGLLLGLAAATVIDAAYLTDERDGRTGWAPQLAVTHDRVQVGVAAAF
ncbi:MAG: hypothetical protein IPH44_42525 [Myxococcales bacterium]|nr:hypothetical protein [Myxococcales bacterium]MBK7192928.1 hypothetical protein [Myxococcales bacterium]MBP6845685.1 hypothetical protein [Kofleriaceae bacterium]